MRIAGTIASTSLALTAWLTLTIAATAQRHILESKTATGDTFTIDTSAAPDLTDWVEKELAPVVELWYPKIVKLLPSEGFQAPNSFRITFSATMRGVAATRRTAIECSADWFRNNLHGEAKGAIVHELVHVAQQYNRSRRERRGASSSPGWLVEGVADYIRWFLYEPESRGAEVDARNAARVRYDDSYRVSANFLNWVVKHYDPELIRKLNAALREDSYQEDLWIRWTERTLEALGDEWKQSIRDSLTTARLDDRENTPAVGVGERELNKLSAEEKSAGWQLLFNGSDLQGWHNFGSKGVRQGWQVTDGILVCADPHNAGDLCTAKEFEWFELKLEYNIARGGNSGIMFHVADTGSYAWETGPELQLEDNARARDFIRSGWLYALYQPPDDPRTGKPLDATKPAGEWNEIRLVVSPNKCLHEMNGVKYFEYVLDSEEFKEKVALSKFREMPKFAKTRRGRIVLQGDHGQISFRNIRIRPID